MDISEILQTAIHSNNYWKHSDFSVVMKTISYYYGFDIEIDIEYIIVDTLSNQYLSVNPDIYNAYFDFMENLKAFSAEDFYFYNVN